MAERLKAPVLKTGMEQSIVGSNPSPSACTADEHPSKSEQKGKSALFHLVGEVPEWSIGAAC